ncbi:MAG TPA: lysophospholipid acyltransferase family protein [Firmicutes bacterium]|nr:lysophospholipid acyltransferase family protein [Bacillota bacterium]HOQ23178.1 lysophospholipid acyltransferase family protein [Bacillota bacterium]HPT66607.1 lysophospholipid acyltransferase family protein [Bacillota bacterium]
MRSWFKHYVRERQDKFFARLAWLFAVILFSTVRFRVVGEQEALSRTIVLNVWHGQQLMGIYYFRGRKFNVLSSLSRDGDLASAVLHRFGWKTVRGSSSRGGSRSLIEMIRLVRAGEIVCLTPDGPSGPVYQVKPGAIYIGQKTGVPLVPISFTVDRYWQLNSWDHFVIPKPFARCMVYYGPGLVIPKELSEGDFQLYQDRLAEAIHDANRKGQKELERWCRRA